MFTVVYADRTFKTVFKQQILTDDDFQVFGSGYTLTIPPAAGLDGLATPAVPPGAVPPVSFGAGAWSASHLKYMKNAPGVIASSYQHFATTMEHVSLLTPPPPPKDLLDVPQYTRESAADSGFYDEQYTRLSTGEYSHHDAVTTMLMNQGCRGCSNSNWRLVHQNAERSLPPEIELGNN